MPEHPPPATGASPRDEGSTRRVLPSVESGLRASLREAFGEQGTGAQGDDPIAARLRKLGEQDARQRYVLEGEVGRGGMGAVLRVFDTDLRRRLAMKVVLDAPSDATGATRDTERQLLARFLDEAQLTGQLDHPGIVPVHELGVDAEGRVYFTMQLVRGEELTKIIAHVHAGQSEWSLTRALGVLLKVCEAMAFAHDSGVIHRDLKPDNVMVGKHGEVYVMDWGLARHDSGADSGERPASLAGVRTDREELRDSAAGSPLVTLEGSVVGTPCYMPPEQAEGRVREVGPLADVYAVGAILYHLLAGRPPYDLPGRRRTPIEVLTLVAEGPPAPVRELAKRVPADLEAICEKAMARDPERRYATMGALREDLAAYLENRVVRAHRTGALVELRKWAARNKAFAGLAAGSLVALLASAALIVDRQREALAQHQESVMRLDAADLVVDYLVGLLGSEPAGAITAREIVDRGRASLAANPDVPPVVRAYFEDAMARAYVSMGELGEAEPLLASAWRTRLELHGPDHPYVLATLESLVSLYQAEGRHEEALPLAEELVARTPGDDERREARERLLASIRSSG